MKKIILILLGCFLLTGCGAKELKVYKPLNNDEVINYAKKHILEDIGLELDVSIEKVEPLDVCTAWFDGCISTETVDDGHSYSLIIKNGDITSSGTYKDSYIIDGNKKDAVFRYDYKEQKGLYDIKEEFNAALKESFTKYVIYNDISNKDGYDIFLYSDNYDDLNKLFMSLNNIVIKYRSDVYTSFCVYVYKDENIYNNTDFSKYLLSKEKFTGQSYAGDIIPAISGKTVTRIGSSDGFDKELFISDGEENNSSKEYIDYRTFDYLIYWYRSEPNSYSSNGSTQIFGVK